MWLEMWLGGDQGCGRGCDRGCGRGCGCAPEVAQLALVAREPPQYQAGIHRGLEGRAALGGPVVEAVLGGVLPPGVERRGVHLPVLQHALGGAHVAKRLEADVLCREAFSGFSGRV